MTGVLWRWVRREWRAPNPQVSQRLFTLATPEHPPGQLARKRYETRMKHPFERESIYLDKRISFNLNGVDMHKGGMMILALVAALGSGVTMAQQGGGKGHHATGQRRGECGSR